MDKHNPDFFTKDNISSSYPIDADELASLIRLKKFPLPDKVEGRIKYWHRLTITEFFRVYNKIEASRRNTHINYAKQREKHILSARKYITEHGINTPFEYRDKLGDSKASPPTPATLFMYSITFEELVNRKFIGDSIAVQILYIVSEKKCTVKEIALMVNVDVRTAHRKIAKLREAGYEIKSDREGIWT